MKKHPKGELSRSRYIVLGATLALALSDVQILDAPQSATSSRLLEGGEATDVPEVLDTSGEDAEEVIPNNRSTRGLLPEWDSFELHDQLIRALGHQSFTKPTPIQLKAIPPALQGRDIVGVAETVRKPSFNFSQILTFAQGSGKTLAYGLPVLHKLLSRKKHPASKVRRPVRALILAPTRELALQISSHLNACLNDVHEQDKWVASNDLAVSKPPLVSVSAIVGGISPHKQKRILSRGVDVLVATPGRLWDIIQEVCAAHNVP